MRLKPLAVKIHRWLGLALCLWIVAVGLTGSLLAFRAPLETFLHPRLYLVHGTTGPPRFDRMVAAVSARYPDRQIIQFTRDGLRADESFHVDLTRGSRTGRPVDIHAAGFNPVRDADLEVFVHPSTGAILGERPFWSPMQIVYWFHKELLAPFVGAPYLGALGVALIALVSAGLVYWWPKAGRIRRGLRIVVGRGPRRATRDLHAAGGAVIAALLVTSAATGVFMCYELRIEGWLNAVGLAQPSLAQPSPAPAAKVSEGRRITLQQAADAARSAYPAFDPVVLNLPAAGAGTYGVQMFPRAASRVWGTVVVSVGARDGAVARLFDPRRQRAANTLPLWIIFLHNGQMFGLAGRAVVLAEGLTLCALALTGPWLWWARRRAGRLTSGILGVTPD